MDAGEREREKGESGKEGAGEEGEKKREGSAGGSRYESGC